MNDNRLGQFHFEVPIAQTPGRLPFTVQLSWDENEKITGLRWFYETLPAIHQNPPYGVAALARDLKNFFIMGEPLLPLSWSLLRTIDLSDFQKKVYDATLAIPHGETRTYAWVAHRIGKPLAVRAVGQALRRNPFPILVPCHRVVSGQGLGGFMGKDGPEDIELKLKTFFLEVEGKYRNPYFSFFDSASSSSPLFA